MRLNILTLSEGMTTALKRTTVTLKHRLVFLILEALMCLLRKSCLIHKSVVSNYFETAKFNRISNISKIHFRNNHFLFCVIFYSL